MDDYTIKIQTPLKTHYLNKMTKLDVETFKDQLNAFLLSENSAFFFIEIEDGELLLPYNLLNESEITIF